MVREDDDLAFCHFLSCRPMLLVLRSRQAAADEFIHNDSQFVSLSWINCNCVLVKAPDYSVLVLSFVGHTMNGCEICLMIISYILFVCTIPFSLCVCIKVSYLYYLSHFSVCLR